MERTAAGRAATWRAAEDGDGMEACGDPCPVSANMEFQMHARLRHLEINFQCTCMQYHAGAKATFMCSGTNPA
eukprot:1157483-Pelagomonas_calceolata.AAC.1